MKVKLPPPHPECGIYQQLLNQCTNTSRPQVILPLRQAAGLDGPGIRLQPFRGVAARHR